MNGIVHPFSGALYEQDGAGHVMVSADGRSGLFHGDGRWISGEIREADPQLCGWIAGPMFGNHRVTPSHAPSGQASTAK
jgi:hypothetical protein